MDNNINTLSITDNAKFLLMTQVMGLDSKAIYIFNSGKIEKSK